jgi:hypothetical protein
LETFKVLADQPENMMRMRGEFHIWRERARERERERERDRGEYLNVVNL